MIRIAILTISDKGFKGERQDKSGPAIREMVAKLEATVDRYELVPDDREAISLKLATWADSGDIDLILTSGGTGLSERDNTPEATLAVVEKAAPGLTEAMRAKTFAITPYAILSRAAAGVRGRCLIINLPGSPKGVRECLEVVLPVIPHAVEIIKGEGTKHTPPKGG